MEHLGFKLNPLNWTLYLIYAWLCGALFSFSFPGLCIYHLVIIFTTAQLWFVLFLQSPMTHCPDSTRNDHANKFKSQVSWDNSVWVVSFCYNCCCWRQAVICLSLLAPPISYSFQYLAYSESPHSLSYTMIHSNVWPASVHPYLLFSSFYSLMTDLFPPYMISHNWFHFLTPHYGFSVFHQLYF